MTNPPAALFTVGHVVRCICRDGTNVTGTILYLSRDPAENFDLVTVRFHDHEYNDSDTGCRLLYVDALWRTLTEMPA